MNIYDYMRSFENRDYYVPWDVDLDKIDAVLDRICGSGEGW